MPDPKKEPTFLVESRGLTFIATARTKRIFRTPLELYHLDVAGCHVIDIGGLSGETAVLFHHWGAAHVTVVEGAPENLPLIQANLDRHAVPSRLLYAFVGAQAEHRMIHYSVVDGGYGLADAIGGRKSAAHARQVTVTPMAMVLESVMAMDDRPIVVKCDCEGGELGFTTCPAPLLRRARAYIMETHSKAIATAVRKTFRAAGFLEQFVDGGMARRPMYRFDRQDTWPTTGSI